VDDLTTPPGTIPPTRDFEVFESATWEERAAGYESGFLQVTSRVVDLVLDAARVGPGTRLLDVATGPGDIAGAAVGRGAVATGVDIARAMVDIARRRWPGARFKVGDAHALPFPAGAFDSVTAGFALMHLGRPEVAVADWVRVLAPGGYLAVSVWDERSRVGVLGEVLDAIDACGAPWPATIPDGPSFFRFSDGDELARLLGGAGLADVAVTTTAFDHRIATGRQLWDWVIGGTVRTAAVVLGQPPGAQERIRQVFLERVERHRRGASLVVPVSVKVASGSAR
jgi:SAM-dependent methyltransferase